MKKITLWLFTAMVLLIPMAVFGMQTAVQVNGPDNLKQMKPGIEQSIQTRLQSKGISPSAGDALNVTITQLGQSNISYDAQLNGSDMTSRAFHRDIQSADAISPTIDAMISSLFGNAPTAAAVPTSRGMTTAGATGMTATEGQVTKSIDLPFKATSVATLGDRVYVSDRSTIYKIDNDKPVSWWKAPGKDQIYRLYSYRDSIIALINHQDNFVSYRVTDGKTVKTWPSAVKPSGDGLLSSVLKMKPDVVNESPHWTPPAPVDGNPAMLPAGTDFLATVQSDITPSAADIVPSKAAPGTGPQVASAAPATGPEVITFSQDGKLAFMQGQKIDWASGPSFARLPLSLQQDYSVHVNSLGMGSPAGIDSRGMDNRTAYYHMPPRILVSQNSIYTIDNNAGAPGTLTETKYTETSRVRGITWNQQAFSDQVVSKSSLGYTTDIALQRDSLISLVVKPQGSVLTYTSIPVPQQG